MKAAPSRGGMRRQPKAAKRGGARGKRSHPPGQRMSAQTKLIPSPGSRTANSAERNSPRCTRNTCASAPDCCGERRSQRCWCSYWPSGSRCGRQRPPMPIFPKRWRTKRRPRKTERRGLDFTALIPFQRPARFQRGRTSALPRSAMAFDRPRFLLVDARSHRFRKTGLKSPISREPYINEEIKNPYQHDTLVRTMVVPAIGFEPMTLRV